MHSSTFRGDEIRIRVIEREENSFEFFVITSETVRHPDELVFIPCDGRSLVTLDMAEQPDVTEIAYRVTLFQLSWIRRPERGTRGHV